MNKIAVITAIALLALSAVATRASVGSSAPQPLTIAETISPMMMAVTPDLVIERYDAV